MKFYQNNKLVAVLKKIGPCFGENTKTNKIEMLGNIWELKDGRGKLIDNLIVDFDIKTFNAGMLNFVCKKFKRELDLSNEEVEIIADNQEELEQQRIVLEQLGGEE